VETGPEGRGSGRDQRRYERRALFLDAVLVWRGQGRIRCKVRDYCRGGMFLSWPDDDGPALPMSRGDPIEIRASVPGAGDLALNAELARVLSSGVGVAFTAVQASHLQALDRLAQASRPALAAGAPAANAEALRALVRRVSLSHFREMVDKFLQRADERLFRAARDAANDTEQRSLFDSMNLVKKRSGDLAEAMCSAMSDYLDNLGGEVDTVEEGAEGEQGLSLLEKEEFEELLIIAEIVGKSEPEYKEQLWRLENRLSRIADGGLDRSNNPIAPGSVCRVVASAMGALELPPAHVRLLYEVVEELIIPALGPWYAELEKKLDEAGLTARAPPQPELRKPPRPPRRPAAGRDLEETVEPAVPPPETAAGVEPPAAPAGAGSAGGRAAGPARPASAAESPSPSGQGSAPPGPAGAAGQAPAAQGAPAGPVRVAPAGGAADGAPAEAAADAWGAAPAPAAGTPPAVAPAGASGQYQAARTLLGLQRELGASTGELPVAAAGAASDAPMFSTTDLVDAIDSLESEDAGPWGAETAGETFDRRLQAVLSSRDAGRRMQVSQADALSMASGVAEAIGSDELVPEALRPMMKRLRGMLHKLALVDERFLTDQEHPARQVINKLAELDLEASQDGEDMALRRRLEELIDKLRRYDGDSEVFEQVMGELDELSGERSRRFRERLAEVIRECEAKQEADKAAGKGKGRDRQSDKQVSPEWAVWLERAKQLEIGDALQLKRGNQAAQRVALAWVGEEYAHFVFVNARGERAASMTLQELAMQMRRGTLRPLARSDLPVMDRAIFSTIYRMHDQVGRQALHDPVTGLVNRKKFLTELQRLLVDAAGNQRGHGAALIRVEGAGALLEHAGEAVRDELIKKVARLMSDSLEGRSFVLGRLADEAFGLLLEDVDEAALEATAERLLALVRKIKARYKDASYRLTAAIAGLPLTGSDTEEEIMQALEQSLAELRAAGGDAVSVGGDEAATLERFDWQGWLAQVLADAPVPLARQAVRPVGGAAGKPAYAEVLAGAVEQGSFRPVPEELGAGKAMEQSMRELDRKVIRQSLAWMATNSRQLGELGGCGINLSAHSLSDPSLLDFLLAVLTETLVPPGRVCFEVSEAAAIANLDAVERLVRTLREFGCRFALDRFGGANASQGYLNKLPVDFIKIAPMFVQEIDSEQADLALVKSINEIARLTGKQTIAGGVATGAVRQKLAEVGVAWMQGPAAADIELLESTADG